MDASQSIGLQYNTHSLYGFTESVATQQALVRVRGGTRRAVVISRSSFAGSGRYVGHWTGDNFSTYASMRSSIASAFSVVCFASPSFFSFSNSTAVVFRDHRLVLLVCEFTRLFSLYFLFLFLCVCSDRRYYQLWAVWHLACGLGHLRLPRVHDGRAVHTLDATRHPLSVQVCGVCLYAVPFSIVSLSLNWNSFPSVLTGWRFC